MAEDKKEVIDNLAQLFAEPVRALGSEEDQRASDIIAATVKDVLSSDLDDLVTQSTSRLSNQQHLKHS